MAFYSYIFSANYKRFNDKLKAVAKREKKNHFFLTVDTFYSIVRYGIGLTDYLNYEFYKKKNAERKEYAGIKIQDSFYEQVSPSAYKKRFTVKPNFLEEFKDFTKRDFLVPKEDDFEAFNHFLNKHKTFMSKPYDGLGGADVKKVHTKDIKDKEAYFKECIEGRIFFEELVIQHKDLNKLSPTSVNTMRIVTFNDHGIPRILWAGLRIGNGINSVDNFHAGGMALPIDIETGKLVGSARDKDLNEYASHPVTKVKFNDFQIPFFDEVKKMVLDLSKLSDKILVLGLDVAVTENGPLIIEANRRPGFDVIQVADRRGRMDIIRDVLRTLEKEDK